MSGSPSTLMKRCVNASEDERQADRRDVDDECSLDVGLFSNFKMNSTSSVTPSKTR